MIISAANVLWAGRIVLSILLIGMASILGLMLVVIRTPNPDALLPWLFGVVFLWLLASIAAMARFQFLKFRLAGLDRPPCPDCGHELSDHDHESRCTECGYRGSPEETRAAWLRALWGLDPWHVSTHRERVSRPPEPPPQR